MKTQCFGAKSTCVPGSLANVKVHEPKAELHDEASVVLLPQFSLAPFAAKGSEIALTEEDAPQTLDRNLPSSVFLRK